MNRWKRFCIWMDKLEYLTPLTMFQRGKFVCCYKDGTQTHTMDYQTASDYAEIFNGKATHISQLASHPQKNLDRQKLLP
jgi:hypothetical protein